MYRQVSVVTHTHATTHRSVNGAVRTLIRDYPANRDGPPSYGGPRVSIPTATINAVTPPLPRPSRLLTFSRSTPPLSSRATSWMISGRVYTRAQYERFVLLQLPPPPALACKFLSLFLFTRNFLRILPRSLEYIHPSFQVQIREVLGYSDKTNTLPLSFLSIEFRISF